MSLNNNQFIAIVPARKGSKGLANKNIFMVNGRPLIDYTIQAAKNSNYINEIYITSDDSFVSDYAKMNSINFIERPKIFSTDEASANDVLQHFLSEMPKDLVSQDPYLIYLQPTSPLRNSFHIDKAIDILIASDSQQLISVNKMEKSPFKAFKVNENNLLETIIDINMTNKRRQDLPDAFLPNGAIYIFKASFFIKYQEFPSNNSIPFFMDNSSSLDIDSKDDIQKFIDILEEYKK
tara:strand:- start:3211 stop:3918 length:708 start_codon:yes stop_codon:yes gene_type:complete